MQRYGVREAEWDLSGYGKNPAGQPLYRVVWADSRVETVLVDGHQVKLELYDGAAKGKWVLEKFLPAEQAMGCAPEAFTEKCRQAGVDMEFGGDYYMVAILARGGESYAHALVQMTEWGLQLTPAEKARRLRAAMEADEKQAESKKTEVLGKALERKEHHA